MSPIWAHNQRTYDAKGAVSEEDVFIELRCALENLNQRSSVKCRIAIPEENVFIESTCAPVNLN